MSKRRNQLEIVRGRRCRRVAGWLVMATLLCFRPMSAQEQPALDMQTQTTGSTSAPTPTPSPSDSGWHFTISPYLWFAGNHGTVGLLNREASIHASAGDLLSHLDIGLMGVAEAHYKSFLLNGDLLWIRLSDGRALPITSLGAVSADARVGQLVWTSKLGHRLIDGERFKADVNLGVRYWHLSQKLSFNPSVLGIDFNRSQNWADFIIGGRVQLPVGQGEKAVVDLLGDVGGWGAAADLDYQFAAVLGLKVSSRWTLLAGYRYLFIDYRNGGGVINTVTSGALLGATYKFK